MKIFLVFFIGFFLAKGPSIDWYMIKISADLKRQTVLVFIMISNEIRLRNKICQQIFDHKISWNMFPFFILKKQLA